MHLKKDHWHTSRHLWHEMNGISPKDVVSVTGQDLSLAQVVAVSKYVQVTSYVLSTIKH